MAIQRALDQRVRIKPVFLQLIHRAAYEGPCRVGELENLTPEADRRRGRQAFEAFKTAVEENATDDAEVLEPALVQWADDFVVPDGEVEGLAPDIYDADLILVGHSGLPQYPAVRIAERFRKPLAMIGHVSTVDVTAYLRARDLEGYAFFDWEDLNRFLSLLRVRKALQHTRMLIALKGNVIPTGVVSSIGDLENLKRRYGVHHELITAEELLDAMRELPQEEAEQARELTAELIANAEQSDMDEDQLLPSVRFYVAARCTLARHEANALTLPCFEICATQAMAEERVTFCLAHSLLKDEGIPSACEGDVNVLMSIAALMYVSRKTPYMGNTSVADREDNIIRLGHDMPGLKMHGFDQPDLPYGIKNFTMGGWGGTLRYDISRDVGEPVTIARFNPAGTRLLVETGEVVDCTGYMDVGCSLAYHMRVDDAERFFRLEQDFGHHFALVLGDYLDQLEEVGRLAGFEVVEA
ncbi:MAG: hypothetical protein U9R79_17225 [Armatimonadota bacterium]|nr:hypothetical protein [Armatimonadota bacterium]